MKTDRSILRCLASQKLLVIILGLVVTLSLADRNFFTFGNLLDLFNQITINGIMAVGMTVLLISGAFDLSIGSVMAFTGIVIVLTQQYGIWVSTLLGLAAGTAIGALNGLLVVKGRINAFIATLGTMIIFKGLGLAITKSQPIKGQIEVFQKISQSSVIGIPLPVLYLAGMCLLFGYILIYTKFGRNAFAIGGNVLSAKLAGINVNLNTFLYFVLCAFTAALAGCILTSRVNTASAVFGDQTPLLVIAATVLGGTSLFGGKGTILGTIQGVIILGLIEKAMVVFNVDTNYQLLLRGTIIIGVVVADALTIQRDKRQPRPWAGKSLQEAGIKKPLKSRIQNGMAVALPVVLIGACLCLIIGTGRSGKKISIGFSLPFIEDSPYTFPYAQALKREAAARGWNLIMTDAKGDLNQQVNQIEDLVNKGVRGLLIMPIDAAGIVPVIKKTSARTKGKLPILTSNVMTDPKKLDALSGFAGPNTYLEGRLMGEYYVNYFKAKGIDKINYCEVTGTAGYSATLDRRKGFEDRVRELGWSDKFILLDRQPGDWSPDKAQKITENWLTIYGHKIQMIYAHNDGMGIGVVKAIQDAKFKAGDIMVNGCDGQVEAVELVQQGWMLFTVLQSPVTDAATAMKTMEKILNGEDVDYFTYMETPIVDKSNADKTLPVVKEIWGIK